MNDLLPDIEQVRVEFAWSLRHRVMYPDKPFDFVKLPQDEEALHYGLFVERQVVSVVSLFLQEKGKAQFRKMATEVAHQGKGYATALLTYVFSQAIIHERSMIWCNARVAKVGFYERLGMRITDTRFQRDGIDFVIMEKSLTA